MEGESSEGIKGGKNASPEITLGKGKSEMAFQQQHTATMQVDGPLLRFLVGKGGSVKLKLEEETGAVMEIPSKPKSKFGSTQVDVRGPSKESVNSAVKRMEAILEEAVKSPSFQYTHFISLPLARPALIEKLTAFRQAVMSSVASQSDASTSAHPRGKASVAAALGADLDPSDAEEDGANADEDCPPADKDEAPAASKTAGRWHGIEESVFITPATFHLTVLMLKLWNNERIQRASAVLQSTLPAVHDALEGRPLVIQLNGIKNMRGSPAKAHVLYADVIEKGEGDRLKRACTVLREAFIQSGLVLEKDEREKLLLHATLINTSSRRAHKGKFRRIPVDARRILADHGETDWGEFEIEEAQLSQRFLYQESGYYFCCCSIPFPSNNTSSG